MNSTTETQGISAVRQADPSTNGHAPSADPTALSGTLLAHLCGHDPETPINEALSGEALAAFSVHNSARRKIRQPWYAIDSPLCDVPALPIAVAHHMGLEPTRDEITEWSVEAMEDDPHDVMAEFDAAKTEYAASRAQERIADRTATRTLRGENVSARARFTVETIESVEDIGPDVARACRALVLKTNRQAWSAIRPNNDFFERTDVMTAVELVRLGVDAAVIAALIAQGRTATDDDEIDANERLSRARDHYKRHGTADVVDVAGAMVSPEQMRELEPPRRMLGHWLYFAQLSELIAEPAAGKTFVALGMALSLASGRTLRTIGLPAPRRVKTLYVAAEAPESLYLRVPAWCQQHGIAPADLTGWFTEYPGAVQLGDPEHMRQVRKYVKDNDVELVVFDTRHMVTMGLDENSSGEQGVAIRALKDLNADGAATLVVHHTPKDGKLGDGGRGSGAWFAAAYTSMYLKVDDKLAPVLVCDKIKDGKCNGKHQLHFEPVTVSADLMPHARDEEERDTLVLAAIDPMVMVEEAIGPSPKALNLLLLLAQNAGSKGMTVTEMMKRASTRDDPDTGYDIGRSPKTVYGSVKVLCDDAGIARRYIRATGDPMRCRVTDAGWDLLVERELITADYAQAHRYTAEDVGTDQFATACENIAAAMTELIRSGEVLATASQTETAVRRLVESYMGGQEQQFSTAAWAAVHARWKDDGRPEQVETAATAQQRLAEG